VNRQTFPLSVQDMASNQFVSNRLSAPGGKEIIFYIDKRYDVSAGKVLGSGSFGTVCSAFDLVRKEKVAIKRVTPYCGDEWDARHALREIRVMRLLSPHPNVSNTPFYFTDLHCKFHILSSFLCWQCQYLRC
jgi:hypothetical protein